MTADAGSATWFMGGTQMPTPRRYGLLEEARDHSRFDDSPGGRVRRTISASEAEMDRRVREIANRERARHPSYDPTIRIRYTAGAPAFASTVTAVTLRAALS
jgi:hypothetical protein